MDEVTELYDRGEQAFKAGDYEKARQLFIQVLAIDLNHDRARNALKGTLIRIFQQNLRRDKRLPP